MDYVIVVVDMHLFLLYLLKGVTMTLNEIKFFIFELIVEGN